ncbi:MAG: hypothetical protein HOW73_34915 [Polyangiaceae bacterium]|nr:hypothetical protein [Polyangiaceae bacterium]
MTNGVDAEGFWELCRHDWDSFEVERGANQIPRLLRTLLQSSDEAAWSFALARLELIGSDLGIPRAVTPALVSCLSAATLHLSGRKRSDVLSLLEELTCGRSAEGYSEDEQQWHRESVHELMLGMRIWVHLMETSSTEDATMCVDLLAYCAEHFPVLRVRVRTQLQLCAASRPELGAEIQAVSVYFSERV